MSIRKLTNRGKLPRYKDGIIDTSEGQWLVERILAWRQYLALRLDYKPQQILLTSRVPLLARALKELSSTSDIPAVAKLLEHFLVPLMFHPAAKLLCAYLEESGASLAKMKDTRCHHCNGLGHSVSDNNLICIHKYFVNLKICLFDINRQISAMKTIILNLKERFGQGKNNVEKMQRSTRGVDFTIARKEDSIRSPLLVSGRMNHMYQKNE